MLEHMEGRDDVEARRRERRPENVPDVELVGEPARLLRRGLVHLDAADPPAERPRHGEPGARAAADVEIAAAADPRQAAPAEATEQRARPEAREQPDVPIAQAAVPEAARERPPHGADARG